MFRSKRKQICAILFASFRNIPQSLPSSWSFFHVFFMSFLHQSPRHRAPLEPSTKTSFSLRAPASVPHPKPRRLPGRRMHGTADRYPSLDPPERHLESVWWYLMLFGHGLKYMESSRFFSLEFAQGSDVQSAIDCTTRNYQQTKWDKLSYRL